MAEYKGDVDRLNPAEKELLTWLSRREEYHDVTITRRSDVTYDLDLEGTKGAYLFRAWLPLATIGAIDWTSPDIWGIQDGYGEPGSTPVQGYDWSGIRDSSSQAHWDMFFIALVKIDLLGETGRPSGVTTKQGQPYKPSPWE